MARLRYNLLQSVITTDLDIGDTSIDFNGPLQEGGVDIPTISSPDILALRIDEEIMHLTAYTSGASSGTVLRAQEDTAEDDHFAGAAARHAITKEDAGGGGGGGGGSVVVYASDALDPQGEFVCDGTDDEDVVLAAMLAVDAGASGLGVVQLSEGSFHFSGPLVWPAGTDLHLVGSKGWAWGTSAATRILMASGAGPIVDGVTNLMSVSLEGLFLEMLSTTADSDLVHCLDGRFIDCAFRSETTVAHRGIEVAGGRVLEVERCMFWRLSRAGIYAVAPYLSFIRNSYFFTSGSVEHCIEVDGNAAGAGDPMLAVTDCRSDGNGLGFIHTFNGAAAVDIGRNQLYYDTDSSIFIEDSVGVTIIGNQLGQSGTADGLIKLSGSDACTVDANSILGAFGHGIQVIDGDDNVITDNVIVDAGTSTPNTYSGVLVDGDSNDNDVHGNKVVARDAAAALQYGIRVDDATCDDNVIYGNDVKGSYVTAGVSDAGTGTVTTAGNRT